MGAFTPRSLFWNQERLFVVWASVNTAVSVRLQSLPEQLICSVNTLPTDRYDHYYTIIRCLWKRQRCLPQCPSHQYTQILFSTHSLEAWSISTSCCPRLKLMLRFRFGYVLNSWNQIFQSQNFLQERSIEGLSGLCLDCFILITVGTTTEPSLNGTLQWYCISYSLNRNDISCESTHNPSSRTFPKMSIAIRCISLIDINLYCIYNMISSVHQ